MSKTTDYQDGYNAGFGGKRDKSEMYFQNWGKVAAEDYSRGYRKGMEDVLKLEQSQKAKS